MWQSGGTARVVTGGGGGGALEEDDDPAGTGRGWDAAGPGNRATTRRARPHPVPSQVIFIRKSSFGRSPAALHG